jgi:hypothetical protein
MTVQPRFRGSAPLNPPAAPNVARRVFPRVIQRCKTTDLEPVNAEISVSAVLDNKHGNPDYYQTKGTNVTLKTLSKAIDEGKIYYASGEDCTRVTKEAINELWDQKYSGFTSSGAPDWGSNCAEYAIGTSVEDGDIGASKTHLSTHWTKVFESKPELSELERTFAEMQGTYVCSVGSHFLRVEIASKGGTVKASQKDAESAVYSKTVTGNEAARLLASYDTFWWALYKKP